MNLIKRMAGLAFLGCLTAGLLAGCGDQAAQSSGKSEAGNTGPVKSATAAKQGPAAQGVAAAVKVDISVPQPIDNPNVFVMGRLHDPDQILERLGGWVSMVDPTKNAASLRADLTGAGLDLKQLKPGENLSMFVLTPPAAAQTPSAAILVPVNTSSTMIQSLGSMMGNTRVTPLDPAHTLLTPASGEGTTTSVQMGPELVKLSQLPIASDLQVYVNASTLMAKYGPMLNGTAQMMLSGMLAAQGNTSQTEKLMPMIQSGVQTALNGLNQVQYLNLGADLGLDRLDLSLILKGKAGSQVEKFLQGAPTSAPDLVAYLNSDAFERMQISIRNNKEMIDFGFNILAAVVKPEQQAAVAKMKEDLKDLDKLGVVHTGVSASVTPEGQVREEMLVMTDDNDAYIAMLRKCYADWINAGPLHDLIKNFGMDMTLTQDPAPRKVEGSDIYHYTLGMKVLSGMPEAQKAHFEKMMGNMTFEMGKVGKYVAITLGEPIDALARRVASNQPGQPLQAMKVYPAGGCFYLDYNIARLFEMMKATNPGQAAQMPNLPADTPSILMAGYMADGLGYFRMGIPKGLVSAIAKVRQQAAMGGGGMVPPPAGVTPPTTH